LVHFFRLFDDERKKIEARYRKEAQKDSADVYTSKQISEFNNGALSALHRHATKFIKGTIFLIPGHCKFYEVFQAAAQEGYGPLLYDVAMSYVTNKGSGLTSSRTSVKPAARGVWNYYLKNRPDVQKKPIASSQCVFHGGKVKQDDALNYVYYLPKFPKITQLVNNAEKLAIKFKRLYGQDFESKWIYIFGDSYFESRYRL
jgi:hypothetical protein